MPRLLSRYATPFITGLFLVSLVSGVALYFHWGASVFREMHEVLSLVLVVPFVLHAWRNWRPLLAYLGRAPMTVALGLSAAAALAFALTSGAEGASRGGADGPPPFALAATVLGNPPAAVAPVLGTTPEDLAARLAAAGFTIASPDETLAEIAAGSGRGSDELIAAILPAAS